MIHFEGERHIPLPVATVAERLSDAGFLANAIPDAQLSEASADKAVGKIKPAGVSFLTGSLSLTATVAARDPGKAVTYQIETKTMGAGSTVAANLAFEEADGGTRVRWTGDITAVTGLLKMVPKGLLEGTAKKVIDDVWAAVERRLAS